MADADAHVPGSVIFVYIDALFKLALNRGLEPPVFQQTEESGPPRHRTFTWTCTFHQIYSSEGHGRSPEEAKNEAAKSLIQQLDLTQLPPPLQ